MNEINKNMDNIEIKIIDNNNRYPYINIEKIVLELFKQINAKPPVATAYWALRQLASYESQEAKIRQSNLAKWALQSKPTVQRSLNTLEKLGFIKIERNYNAEKKQYFANTYTILPVFDIAMQLKLELKPLQLKKDVSSATEEIAATIDPKLKQKKKDESIEFMKEQIFYDKTIEYYDRIINDAINKNDAGQAEARKDKKSLYLAITDVLFNILQSSKDYLINGAEVLNEDVREKLLNLTSENINYIVIGLSNTSKKIKNKEAYILKSLYSANAGTAIEDSYWFNEAQRDFAKASND